MVIICSHIIKTCITHFTPVTLCIEMFGLSPHSGAGFHVTAVPPRLKLKYISVLFD